MGIVAIETEKIMMSIIPRDISSTLRMLISPGTLIEFQMPCTLTMLSPVIDRREI